MGKIKFKIMRLIPQLLLFITTNDRLKHFKENLKTFGKMILINELKRFAYFENHIRGRPNLNIEPFFSDTHRYEWEAVDETTKITHSPELLNQFESIELNAWIT